MRVPSCACLGALCMLGSLAATFRSRAAPRPFEFTIERSASPVDVTLGVAAETSGTLIGDHDPAANPGGTRTKPGLFGTFGADENVAVPVQVDPTTGGRVRSALAGAFRLTLDAEAGTAALSGLDADLSGGPGSPPVPLTTSARFTFDSFRTRSPSSTYFGTSVDLPLGDALVSGLRATQAGDSAVGTLVPVGGLPAAYDFAVVASIVFGATVTFQGSTFEAPTTPVAVPFTGRVTLDGESAASIAGSIALAVDETAVPMQPLDPFAFDLPTILPPGDTAGVIFSLLLERTTLTASGPVTVAASGALVPEPATVPLLLALTPLLRRMRAARAR